MRCRLESAHVGYSNESARESGGGRKLRGGLAVFVGGLRALFAQARRLVSHRPFPRPPGDRNKGGHEQDCRRDRQVPAEARAPRRRLVRDRTPNRARTSARSPEQLAGGGRGDGTAVRGVRTRLQEGGRYRGECDEEERGDETCRRRSCASPCPRPVLRSRPQDRAERADEDAQTTDEPDVP